MRILSLTILFLALATGTYASNKTQVAIKIESQAGKMDEASVYFDQGVNPSYNFQEDAQKVVSGISGIPVIYTLTSDLVNCSLNGFGTLTGTEVVPLGYDVDASGVYTLSASALDNVPATSIVRLEDRQTGIFTDLRSNVYAVQLNDNDPATGRFFLHISFPTLVETTDAGCSNNDGLINITQDNTVSWDAVKLLDVFNNQIATLNNATGQFDFNSLPQGHYYLVYIYGNYSTTEEIYIHSNFVTAEIISSTQNVIVGEPITFSAITANANQFNWDFGDGTLITGVANPTISYYEPGTYTVNLVAANYMGCAETAQSIINVSTVSGIDDQKADNITVFAHGNTVTVNLNGAELKEGQVQIFNLIGQPVYSRPLNSSMQVINMDSPIGYYLVSVSNAEKTITKRVFIAQ